MIFFCFIIENAATAVAANDSRERMSERSNDRETRSSTGNGASNNNNVDVKSERSSSRPSSRDVPAPPAGGHGSDAKWNYPPNLQDVMATGAFWQNYSGWLCCASYD